MTAFLEKFLGLAAGTISADEGFDLAALIEECHEQIDETEAA